VTGNSFAQFFKGPTCVCEFDNAMPYFPITIFLFSIFHGSNNFANEKFFSKNKTIDC